MPSNVRVVLVTAPSVEQATSLARALVESKVAACVNIVPGVRSIYEWEGKIEESAEALLVIKSNTEKLPALEAKVHELHPYETPEFVTIEPSAVSPKYQEWITQVLG